MKEQGTVLAVKKHVAFVVVPRSSACGEHCATCSAVCNNKTAHRVWVKNPIHAPVGSSVTIYASDASILRSAFLVYLLPLLFFFIAYGVTYTISSHKALSALVGLLALAAVFFFLSLFDKRLAPTPQIIRVHHDPVRKDESHGL